MIEMLFAIFRRSIDLPLKVLGLKYKSRKAEGETRADEARSDAQIPPESKASDIVGTSFSTPQLKGRLALLGFPGAGNVLAATIASHLSEMYAVADDVASTQQDQQTEKVLADFSSRYNLLTRVLADAVPKHWDANTYIQHGELNLANFHVDIDNTTSVALTRLPLPTHLNSKIHAAHQVADMRASSFFDSRGYTVAVTIRHPLEIIRSYARKLAPNHPDWTSDEDWNKITRKLLNSSNFVIGTARLLADFYRDTARAGKYRNVQLIRHEDCVISPIAYVQQIGRLFGLELSEGDAIKYTKYIGAGVLAPGHIFSPTKLGKWNEAFSPEILEQISQKSDLFEVFAELGYPPATALEASGFDGDGFEPGEIPASLYYSGLIGITSPMNIAEVFGLEPPPHRWVGDYLAIGSTQEIVNEFVGNLEMLIAGRTNLL